MNPAARLSVHNRSLEDVNRDIAVVNSQKNLARMWYIGADDSIAHRCFIDALEKRNKLLHEKEYLEQALQKIAVKRLSTAPHDDQELHHQSCPSTPFETASAFDDSMARSRTHSTISECSSDDGFSMDTEISRNHSPKASLIEDSTESFLKIKRLEWELQKAEENELRAKGYCKLIHDAKVSIIRAIYIGINVVDNNTLLGDVNRRIPDAIHQKKLAIADVEKKKEELASLSRSVPPKNIAKSKLESWSPFDPNTHTQLSHLLLSIIPTQPSPPPLYRHIMESKAVD